jgi:hypothetical protein
MIQKESINGTVIRIFAFEPRAGGRQRAKSARSANQAVEEQKGIERGCHGRGFPALRATAPAVGWPGGRKLTRKSTRAVISSGLICLP